jgi:hypothetical protein
MSISLQIALAAETHLAGWLADLEIVVNHEGREVSNSPRGYA